MRFTAAQGVEVKEVNDLKELTELDKLKDARNIDVGSDGGKKSFSGLSFNELYKKFIYNRFKGDKLKITLFTLVIMWLSEVPIYFFTLLDVLKLESLFKYRIHYIKAQTEHLGIRNYPPWDLTYKTMKNAEFNFIFAYLVPAFIGITAGAKLGIFVYDTSTNEENEENGKKESKKLTWYRFFKEVAMISVLADLGFYWMHRILHTPRFYLEWHKKHHDFKYSIAFAHHWMTYKEAFLFMSPQVLPPILLWFITGHKMHITSMWAGAFFTQLNGILGHAGYRMPFIPKWIPFFQGDYHDFHHVDYSGNFGAIFPWIDKIFGTYNQPKLELNMAKVMQNVKK